LGWVTDKVGFEDAARSLQFYAYYDIGRVWVDPGPSTHLSGASTGGGFRYTLTDYLAGYFEVGLPLTRGVASDRAKGQSGKAPRFFFSIATKF
jgi:hemolysin activation/secretion protein